MVPQFSFKVSELEEKEKSNLTYRLDLNKKRIYGRVDNYEAAKQAVIKLLLTERFENIIYTDAYGVELKRFIGRDIDFIKSDIERTITETILIDDRFIEVLSFVSEERDSSTLDIRFEVRTVYGDVRVDSEVKI